MKFKMVDTQTFKQARDNSKRLAFLSDEDTTTMDSWRKFIDAETGTVGFAIDDRGTLCNLFNNGNIKGAGKAAVRVAIKYGATRLDCFDGYLVRLYEQFGFRETSRVKFDPQFAPKNWDYAELGTPDVVFMSLDR